MTETNACCAASIRRFEILTRAANDMYEPSQFVRGLDLKGRVYLTDSAVRTFILYNGVQSEPIRWAHLVLSR